MDMPGYGRADRPRDFDYTMAGYARHLEGILKATGIDGAHLVTHDFGHARAVCRLYRATKPIDAIARAMAPKLRAIDPPTLVIWGTGDAYLPEKYAAAQKETFPKAEVHLLHGCGHWPFIDDPRAVEERLLPFLRRQWASR